MKEIRHEEMKKRWSSLSADDWNEINVQAQILGAILSGRKEKSLTQKELGDLSGVAQTFIARLENFRTDPRLSTVLKILRTLGKTLAVVPMTDHDAVEKQSFTEGYSDHRSTGDYDETSYDVKEADEGMTASVSSAEKFEDMVVA